MPTAGFGAYVYAAVSVLLAYVGLRWSRVLFGTPADVVAFLGILLLAAVVADTLGASRIELHADTIVVRHLGVFSRRQSVRLSSVDGIQAWGEHYTRIELTLANDQVIRIGPWRRSRARLAQETVARVRERIDARL